MTPALPTNPKMSLIIHPKVSDWCGPPCPCLSWGWAPLCDTGRNQGEERSATGWSEPFCPATAQWLGADKWSTAACWRSHWPAECKGWIWSALCCWLGNSSSLEKEKGEERTMSESCRTHFYECGVNGVCFHNNKIMMNLEAEINTQQLELARVNYLKRQHFLRTLYMHPF